jgi:hypothetical protein
MKTYYFEDHIKISDRKPVEGYVEAYNGENKIFEGHNLVVNAGRMAIRDFVMGNVYLFYGSDGEATISTTLHPSNTDNICKIPTKKDNNNIMSIKNNNISITRVDDEFDTTLKITINPIIGSSESI